VNCEKLIVWEVLDPQDAVLSVAQRLYESTQLPEEAIPWKWIARTPAKRHTWRPGQWSPHLLLAAIQSDELIDPPLGFVHGAHVPDFGGYVCYIGVDPEARGRGVAARLFEQMFRVLAVDAGAEGVALPFVLWESHRPADDAPEAEHELWSARIRLFDKVGAYWIDGIQFQSPNYVDRSGPPVPLELFLVPQHLPASAFDADRLREIIAALHAGVYGNGPGDALFEATLPVHCAPRLRPARDADLACITG